MFQVPNLLPLLPEIFVLMMACVVLIVDVYSCKKNKHFAYVLAQLTLLGVAVLTLREVGSGTVISFQGSFILDSLSIIIKLFIYLLTFGAFVYAKQYIQDRDMPMGEYYALGLFSMLGMMVLVSSCNLLTLYLGLELLSLPIYAMVALQRDKAICTEASMKYFVMGAMASGMLLYGFSMLYGATHSLNIAGIAQSIAGESSQNNLMLVFGLVFIVVGLGFKLGAVPFHMWVPDVYEGAPTSVTLFLGGAPKLAGLALVFRLLIDALPHLAGQWHQMLLVMAILSMGIGNILAIAQSSLKRMLAYSSIAHMGYMMLGLLSGTKAGYASSLFYMVTYTIMSMGAFAVLIYMAQKSMDVEAIEDLKGLNARNPWLAFMMLLLMFSMAGIPPTVGFFAKMGVLEALISVHEVWLAAVALLFAIIGCYYYLRVVKTMYFDAPEDASILTNTLDVQIAISVNGLFVLLLGLFPSALIVLCRHAFGL